MLVGLTGKKGCGKTTAAEILVQQGYTRLSFAGTLRKMATVLLVDLGLPSEEVISALYEDKEAIIPALGVSGRHILQTLGTDWGRLMIHPDVWVMTTEQTILEAGEADIVFDDVRFDNEAQMLNKLGCTLIQLQRVSAEGTADTHASEAGVDSLFIDGQIQNDGDFEHLSNMLNLGLNHL